MFTIFRAKICSRFWEPKTVACLWTKYGHAFRNQIWSRSPEPNAVTLSVQFLLRNHHDGTKFALRGVGILPCVIARRCVDGNQRRPPLVTLLIANLGYDFHSKFRPCVLEPLLVTFFGTTSGHVSRNQIRSRFSTPNLVTFSVPNTVTFGGTKVGHVFRNQIWQRFQHQI